MLTDDNSGVRRVLTCISLRHLEKRLLLPSKPRPIPISGKPDAIGYEYPADKEGNSSGLLDRQYVEARNAAFELELLHGPAGRCTRKLAL